VILASSVIVTGRSILFPQQSPVFFMLTSTSISTFRFRPSLEAKRLERHTVRMLRTGKVMRTFHHASSWRVAWLRTEVRVYLYSKLSSLLSVVFVKALLISIELLVSLTFWALLCVVCFLHPPPVDKKQNADTKSKEMRNRPSLWQLKLGAKGYTAHIVVKTESFVKIYI
jgi:hypothetical protein